MPHLSSRELRDDPSFLELLDLRTQFGAAPERELSARYQDWAARVGPWLTVSVVLALALWWPLDAVVFAGKPEVIARMAEGRETLLVGIGAVYLGGRALEWWRPALYRNLAIALHVALLLAGAAYISRLCAHLSAWGGPYFHFTYMFPVLTCMVPGGARRRVAACLAMLVVILLGYFGTDPTLLSGPAAKASASFLVFITALCGFIGEVFHRLFLAGHVFQRRLAEARAEAERANAALARLNGELESRVEAQTRELRALALNIERLREEERTWMAQEIHDGVGQEMTALRVNLAVVRALGGDSEAFSALEVLMDRVHMSLRRVLKRLRPRVLDDVGLAAALAWLAADVSEWSRLRCRYEGPDRDPPFSAEHATALFRIAQEGLNNVVRHARAKAAWVTLEVDEKKICLTVDDDGVGFGDQARAASQQMGLLGIKLRVTALGGVADFDASPRGGARVRVTIPWEVTPRPFVRRTTGGRP